MEEDYIAQKHNRKVNINMDFFASTSAPADTRKWTLWIYVVVPVDPVEMMSATFLLDTTTSMIALEYCLLNQLLLVCLTATSAFAPVSADTVEKGLFSL